ncbi:unnamed protein product, partial [Owenia fusiformis]
SHIGSQHVMSASLPKESHTVSQILRNNQVNSVMLHGVPIVCLFIDGQERLCLAQISNTLLKQYSYNEIHNRRVALGITCVQCTPVQLEILRRAGAMPISSRRCGMITKREAERLVKSFLEDNTPPKLPDDFAFDCFHECGWGCTGSFTPSRYNSSRAKCIKCNLCNLYFSPNKFIFHFHRTPEAKYNHPDAANFNSWRRHLKLCGTNHSEELISAWEDVKAMFNGGSRKRTLNHSSLPQQANKEHAHLKRHKKEQQYHEGSPRDTASTCNVPLPKLTYPFSPHPAFALPYTYPKPHTDYSKMPQNSVFGRQQDGHYPYEFIWANHLGIGPYPQMIMSQAKRLHAPSDRLHAPSERLHAPSERLHAPSDRLHAPSERLHAPSEILHSPSEPMKLAQSVSETSCQSKFKNQDTFADAFSPWEDHHTSAFTRVTTKKSFKETAENENMKQTDDHITTTITSHVENEAEASVSSHGKNSELEEIDIIHVVQENNEINNNTDEEDTHAPVKNDEVEAEHEDENKTVQTENGNNSNHNGIETIKCKDSYIEKQQGASGISKLSKEELEDQLKLQLELKQKHEAQLEQLKGLLEQRLQEEQRSHHTDNQEKEENLNKELDLTAKMFGYKLDQERKVRNVIC